MATDFFFSRNDILSFNFLLKPLLQLEGRQYFKIILFRLEETGFFIFFLILIRMEVAFRPSEITFCKKPFILTSRKGFCKELFILASRNRFCKEAFILASRNGFSINFVLKTLCFYPKFLCAGGHNSPN